MITGSSDYVTMPNLLQIQGFHKAFKPDSDLAKLDTSAWLHESLNPDRIEKGFQNINGLSNDFIAYFEGGANAEVALVYIDICSFSSRYASLTADDLSTFLDGYYARIIPIIYDYGGEIDRIMGDGIVAVFGPPFLNINFSSLIVKALACSLKTIVLTHRTEFYSKVALHAGQVRYYRNKSIQYPEYTLIGKPITELYRLESIAPDNAIIYYADSSIDQGIEVLKRNSKLPVYNNPNWVCTGSQRISSALKGVHFSHVKQIQHR